MTSKSVNHTSRDFIDFLLLLYRHSKFFFITLILLVGLATYVNLNQNPNFKYSIKITAPASNDVFMPIIMYRDALRMASNEAITNKGNEFSSLGVDRLLHDLLQGGRLFPILEQKISNSQNVNLSVREYVSVKRVEGGFEVEIESSDPYITSLINENLMPVMQSEITRVFHNIIQTHKVNALNKIKSLIKSDTGIRLRNVSTNILKISVEENSLQSIPEALKESAVYSPYNESLDYVENLEIPNLDLDYIYFVQTPVTEVNPLPRIFIYLFSFFLSVFLFVFIVIIIDLKNQVFLRKESQS